MAKTKGIEVGKFVQRNNMLKKIGLDTDNCISWIENEKLSPGYKPRIAKRRNFLYTNYVVFSELMHLISNKDLTIKSEEVIGFLKRNHIRPIKKKDVDKIKVEETFNKFIFPLSTLFLNSITFFVDLSSLFFPNDPRNRSNSNKSNSFSITSLVTC